MSRNNNYQQIQELISSIPSLQTEQKDIVCNDCGGISATKIQQLLSTLEGTTKLFNRTLSTNKKIKSKSAKNNNQKNSLRRKKKPIIRKRKINIKKSQSSRNNNRNKSKKKIR